MSIEQSCSMLSFQETSTCIGIMIFPLASTQSFGEFGELREVKFFPFFKLVSGV